MTPRTLTIPYWPGRRITLTAEMRGYDGFFSLNFFVNFVRV